MNLYLNVLEKILPFFSVPFLCISAGGGVSNTDTSFERSGTSTSSSNHTVPSGLAALLSALGTASQPQTGLTAQQSTALSSILTRPTSDVPNPGVVNDTATQSPTGFEGFSNLRTMSNVDPYSDQFETDTTEAYQRRAGEALAGLQSGPMAVRGATERVPMAQGQAAVSLAEGRGGEVRQAQTQQAGISQGAAQLMELMQAARRAAATAAQSQQFQQIYGILGQRLGASGGVDSTKGANSQGLNTAANWLSGNTSSTTDALRGKGSQGSSHFGGEVGTNCCFIFLQALNGLLPWYIDLARRDYYTPKRQRGYKWMARWLVPKMASSKLVSAIVNLVLIKPFLKYGSWLYGAGSRVGWVFAPYCKLWLGTWNMIGGVVK